MADSGRIVNGAWMPALDENGYPIPDAYIRVFTNRTTTLAPIYADEARTVLRSNPVYADSSGQFPPIWQDNTLSFSLEFGSVTKGPIATVDDLKPSSNIGGLSEKLDRDGGNPTPDFLENVGAQSVEVITYEPTEYKRLLTSKMLDFVNARDAPNFDAVRMIDAKESLEALFISQGPKGGTIYLPPGDIYVSSLVVPPNIRLIGASGRPGQNDYNRSASRAGTTLWVAPTGTINLLNMSWIEHVQILNPHVKHPQLIYNGNATDMTHDQILGTQTIPGWPYNGGYGGINQFAGTAITIGGNDTMVKDCLIIGYNKAIYAGEFYPGSIFGPYPGPSRHNIVGVYMDCTNGVEFTNCWDIPRIRDCNFWVFYCCHLAGPGMQDWDIIARHGIGFNIHDKVDGLMMTNCFASGGDISYRFKTVYAAQVTGCTGDGALNPDIAVPGGAGVLVEGEANGIHLNNIRCDANESNFKFRHRVGTVDGKIISGQTSRGKMVVVEEAPSIPNPSYNPAVAPGPLNPVMLPAVPCNGFTLDMVLMGNSTGAVHVKSGKNLHFRSIDAIYLNPMAGDIIQFDNINDIKSCFIGNVNKDINTQTHGFRVPDKITAAGDKDIAVSIQGAPNAAAATVRAESSTGVTSAAGALDIVALGHTLDTSRVGILRRTTAGISQLLARFDGGTGIFPASWLFRGADGNTLIMAAESVVADVNIQVMPKGSGIFQVFSNFLAGLNQSRQVGVLGADGSNNPSVRAYGTDANIPLDIAGKGSGGVFLLDIISNGSRRILGRFFKGADDAANFVVNNAASNNVVVGVEGVQSNITLGLAGKGTGGITMTLPTYANDGAAAAGGLPLSGIYKTSTGEVRVRIA